MLSYQNKLLNLVFASLVLTGCSTIVPVERKFPEAPMTLLEKPPEMKIILPDSSPAEAFEIIGENYGIAKEYKLKLEAWQNWYKQQKEIFK